jgi:8-oxo-dGTP pyrophosphatase MutT (NUDIX family)
MIKQKSAGAVVFRRDGKDIKYLVLHYEAGHWDFVKGKVEKGEEEKQTVLRELKEETGIGKADFIPDFRKEINYYFKKEGETVFKTAAFYLLETKEEKVKLSFEHVGYRWVGLDTALKTLTFDNAKEIVKEAEDFIKNLEID